MCLCSHTVSGSESADFLRSQESVEIASAKFTYVCFAAYHLSLKGVNGTNSMYWNLVSKNRFKTTSDKLV